MARPNRSGLPEHLRRDKSGFLLDVVVGGKRKRIRLGPITEQQALRERAKYLNVEAGCEEPQSPDISFEEAVNAFLAYSKVRKRSYRRDVLIASNLATFFGGRLLKHITHSDIEKYVVHRRQQRPTLKGSTLNREIMCLKAIANMAIRDRRLDRNPINGVRMFKENPRKRTLTPDEFRKLLEHCAVHLRPMVFLAYVTAMRRGEIFGLRWDQVDFQNKVINLEAADTKTQEKREVPLDEALIEMLRSIPRTLGTPFIFASKNGHVGDNKNAFKGACARAGIVDFRFHDLRHCAITNLRKAGVPDNVIMSISGHKTTAMFRRYDSIDRTDRSNALARLREFGKGLALSAQSTSQSA